MTHARFVRLEGLDKPCLVVSESGDLPDELIIDFSKTNEHWAHERSEPVTFRIQPSSRDDDQPSYVEMFDD